MADLESLQQALGAIPTFPLVIGPTPLERLTLSAEGVGDHQVWIKRDDCTGLAMGGNKSRKLEFSIAHARTNGHDTVLTASGIQSNMVRQTAAAATKAGLEFHTVVAPALETYPAAHIDSGNVLLDCLFGAHIHTAPSEDEADQKILALYEKLKTNGKNPWIIPLGASDGLGSLGYVRCAIELLHQFEETGIQPSRIFVPTGSGGTHGGLLAGLRIMGSDIQVIGISVSDPAPVKIEKVTNSMLGIEEVLSMPLPQSALNDIVVHDDYTGAGYAHPTTEANAALRALARTDGILLDPIYTGKAFAGMLDLLGRLDPSDGPSVFLHTGGTPALFADPGGLVELKTEAPALLPFINKATQV